MDEKEESVSIAVGGLCAMKLKHQKIGFHVSVQKVCAQCINRLKLDLFFHLGHLIFDAGGFVALCKGCYITAPG